MRACSNIFTFVDIIDTTYKNIHTKYNYRAFPRGFPSQKLLKKIFLYYICEQKTLLIVIVVNKFIIDFIQILLIDEQFRYIKDQRN